MRYLSIDYGSKHIGIAVSDEDGKMAFPREIMSNEKLKKAIQQILDIIKKENIGLVVIGLPITFSGGDSEQTSSVRKFIEDFKKAVSVPVHMQNEVLTTKSAKKGSLPKMADASAAALILQDYLDKRK